MSNWDERTQVKKGTYGEQIVDALLVKQGFIPYASTVDGPHPVDRMYAKGAELIIVEVKAKALRRDYPDTGIDIKQYNIYKAIQEKHGLDVYIYFVDEIRKEVYGNKLSVLEMPKYIDDDQKKLRKYPIQQNGIIYFPFAVMILLGKLEEEECAILKRHSTRNKRYDTPKCAVS